MNHNVFDAYKFHSPYFDRAVTALIEDLYDRRLDKCIMVVVTGEFGRTPQISHGASSAGISTGKVIGATDRVGEYVSDRRVGPRDFLATIYRYLGIDYDNVARPDQAGRPIHIVQNGKAIPELVA